MSVFAPVNVPGSTFPIVPALTAVAVRYRNPDANLIADRVCPRMPPTGTQAFRWTKYDLENSLTVTDAQVGRKSEPQTIEVGGTEVVDQTNDYGFDDLIPNSDQVQAEALRAIGQTWIDPQTLAVQTITDRLNLAREVRVATLYQSTASYDEGRQIDLSVEGQYQISDYANSDPIGVIEAGMDSTLIYRPNKIVLGRAAWTKLRSHPKVVQGVFKNLAGGGIVTKEAVAELFEVNEVIVGEGWINSAKPGQAVTPTRIWGKNIMLLYVNVTAAQSDDINFGATAQFMGKVAGAMPEPKVGLRGSNRVRVGESVKEFIAAQSTGYLIANAVA